MGLRHVEGRGTRQDLAQAARWFEAAATRGFAPAQFRLGNLYEKGLGVPRDMAKAMDWYEHAAAGGNTSAMHNLALLLAMGVDGRSDTASAAGWFTSAAERGVMDSQFNLGILAARGAGMPRNLEESYKWFALVAKTGDEDAAAKRDRIALSLTSEQLDNARAAAMLWQPTPVDAAANAVDIPVEWMDDRQQTGIIDAGHPDHFADRPTNPANIRIRAETGVDPSGGLDEGPLRVLMVRQ